jgi:hypothetical protein
MVLWECHQEIVHADPAVIHAICVKLGGEGWEPCGQLLLLSNGTRQGGVVVNSGPTMVAILEFKRAKVDSGAAT